MPGGIDKVAFRVDLSGVLFNKVCVASVLDKTDILTVLLFRVQKLMLCRDTPDFRLT